MDTMTELSIDRIEVTVPVVGCTARELARQYLRAVSDVWLGQDDPQRFENWLAGYWKPALPPRLPRIPDAISPHGGGGRGIDWYETGTTIVGYVRGVMGGYSIPLEAASSGLERLERAHPAVELRPTVY
jgi:hypothetical protein